MGNQVSSNLKNSLLLNRTSSKKKELSNTKSKEKEIIGILSFEVANVMSKLIYLHKSFSHQEISTLKNVAIKSEGVKKLVSSDEFFLLELAYYERLDDLNRAAELVSRLGKKCTEPALQGFQHVYEDITNGKIEFKDLGFLVKDMEGMIRKMERFVDVTTNLYREMGALNELERTKKKCNLNQNEESQRAFEMKLSWQLQDVKQLKDISLWNQTYDKVIDLLARTVCTVYTTICIAFANHSICLMPNSSRTVLIDGGQFMAPSLKANSLKSNADIEIEFLDVKGGEKNSLNFGTQSSFRHQDLSLSCGPNPGRIFVDCLRLNSSVSKIGDNEDGDDEDDEFSCLSQSEDVVLCSGNLKNSSIFGPRSRLASHATLSTVGGSGLALHYANVIIVIEKLLCYRQLVGKEARDDLYQMLPSGLRERLRANLRSYFKKVAIYDAPIAHNWSETLDGMLKWIAPLAHNMIRWQSERNFGKQQQIITRTNVLLLQTLYFADRDKTEAAICKLLIGLNYVCRYVQQQHVLLDCVSSFRL